MSTKANQILKCQKIDLKPESRK